MKTKWLGVLVALIGAFSAEATPCSQTMFGWHGFQHADQTQVRQFAQAICGRNPSADVLTCIDHHVNSTSFRPQSLEYHHSTGAHQDVDLFTMGELCYSNPQTQMQHSPVNCYVENNGRHVSVLKEGALHSGGTYGSWDYESPGMTFPAEAAYELCSHTDLGTNCVNDLGLGRVAAMPAAMLCARDRTDQAKACLLHQVSVSGRDGQAAALLCASTHRDQAIECLDDLVGRGASQIPAAQLCSQNPSPPARTCLLTFKTAGISESLAAPSCVRDPNSAPRDVGELLRLLSNPGTLACVSGNPTAGATGEHVFAPSGDHLVAPGH